MLMTSGPKEMRYYRLLVLLLVLGLIGPFATGARAAADARADGRANGRMVYLVNIGWHVGIALPVDPMLRRNLPEAASFPNAAFLEIGWGDEKFYRAKDPSAAMALEAAFAPSKAVVHLYGFSNPVRSIFGTAEILEVPLERSGYARLLGYLHQSFRRNGDGSAPLLGPGLYGGTESRFYAGTGRFHLLHTCNTWAAEALAAAGLDIEPQGIITAGGLMGAVRQALDQR